MFRLTNSAARSRTTGGRVEGAERTYVAGWIKRGPSGVIGTNKKDATETVELLLEDARAGRLSVESTESLEQLLDRKGVHYVEYAGWQAIDAAERAAGEPLGRPRVKLTRVGVRSSRQGVRASLSVVTDTASTPKELWGGETRKAIANFPVSGEPIPAPVARWLGRIKAAAARVNAELGLLDADKAQRIAAAGDRIAAGELDDQFPIDVFQTGSGTSSNMNANEVIATLAGEDVHANDDVNMGQSSNDVFPSAVHLAALDADRRTTCCRRSTGWRAALEAKADEFADVVKSGRTHWMDAVPVTLGQEFGGYAAQVREGKARVDLDARAARPDPARRHRRRHRAEHASRVRGARAGQARGGHRARHLAARRPVRVAGCARRARRGVRCAEDARGQPDEDRERPALPRLGPARRARGDLPARAAEGLVDHARARSTR